MTRLLIDDVGVDGERGAIDLMGTIDQLHSYDIVVLCRGAEYAAYEGSTDPKRIKHLPFSSYHRDRCNAADSALLQMVCTEFNIDVMITTAWSTALTTPCIMIPLTGVVPPTQGRALSELRLALTYAHSILPPNDAWQTVVDRAADQGSPIPACLADLDNCLKTSFHRNEFYQRWKNLRQVQQQVDVAIWPEG